MRTHISTTALGAAFSIFATSVAADITAADLWADWQEIAAENGATLSAGEAVETAGGLALRDVSIVMDYPEGGMSGTVPEITMTESGGAVTITTSDEYRMDITAAPADGPEGSFALVIRQPDARIVASGAPEDITYDYSLPTLAMNMNGAEIGDDTVEMRLAIELTGVTGTYRTQDAEMRRIDSAFTADALAAALNMVAPDGSGESFEITATAEDLQSTSTGTLSTLGAMGDLSALLEAGLSSEGEFRHGALTYRLAGTSSDGTFTVDGTTDSGTLDFALSSEGLSYGATNTGVTMQIGVPGIPFGPITVAMEESGGRVTMPVEASDEPDDIELVLRLVGITVSDPIWMLFDPTGVLPRDPATVIVDLSGQGNWTIDVLDPDAMQAAEDMAEVPGQIENVTLNELVVEAVGARVTGSGAFAFDNSGPMPDPAGSVELTIDGANALIDRLVTMGIVPEDQAMSTKMMLGLFAEPVGDDSLKSVIEVQPGGAVLANGQRIR